MSESYPRPNTAEPVSFDLTQDDGTPITGANDVTLRVYRISDAAWWDWSDGSFKPGASVVDLDEAMTEPDATRAPGRYEATWPGGATADYEAHVLRAGVRKGRVLLRVGRLPAPGDAMDLVADAVDAAALAASAVAEVQAGLATSAALADMASDAERARQYLTNRREVSAAGGGTDTIYADDGVTPLATHDLRDGLGNPIAVGTGVPARRSAPQ